MSDRILRFTSVSGKPVVVDASGPTIKVVVQDGTKSHTLALSAVKSGLQGHYLELVGGSKVIVSAEDALAVSQLLAAKPKKKGALPFILGGVGVLVLLFIIGSLSGNNSSTTPASTADKDNGTAVEKSAEIKPDATKLGEFIQDGDAVISVTRVLLRDTVGSEYSKETAADGGVLVVVETTVRNVGDKPIKSYELPKVKLIDAAGTEYSPDIGKSGTYAMEADLNAKLMSDLNPDIAVRDAAVFEVSKTRFDPATWFAVTEDGKKIALQ